MNMAMIDSEVEDTISFYLIEGKYLIPCSVLIEASKELKLANSIEITSAYKGYDDIGYSRHSTKSTKRSGHTTLANLYWEKQNDDWFPTDKNKKTY
jgi:hypothetical protein